MRRSDGARHPAVFIKDFRPNRCLLDLPRSRSRHGGEEAYDTAPTKVDLLRRAASAASTRRARSIYPIESPVIFIAFDHHAGVFLTNDEPAKARGPTIVRTPNGNDYGIGLLRLHGEQTHRPQ